MENLPLTEFDLATSGTYMQMIKAYIPFIDLKEQKFISIAIRIAELIQTIKKVSADIEEMKFNTAIAALMTLINEIYAVGHITKDDLIIFIKLLCPFAPHICEEIYSELGEDGFLSVAEWPEFEEARKGMSS